MPATKFQFKQIDTLTQQMGMVAQQMGMVTSTLVESKKEMYALAEATGTANNRVSDTVRAIASVVAERASADGAGLLCASSNGGVRLLRSLPGNDWVPPDDPDDAFSDADLSSLDGC